MPVQIPNHSPWVNQRLVLGALLHREAVTRFGKYKMGILWLLLEPLVSVIVLGLILGPVIGRTAPDMPYAFFLLNGMVLMNTLVGPTTSAIGAINSNLGLLVFPKVQPLDILLARFSFELISSLFSFVIFCIIGMWLGVSLSMASLHILLATFIITWLTGCGLGFALCVASSYYRSVDKIYAFIRRPLIFTSCVLYPLYGLPADAQKILLYNPLVHTIELSRKCFFPHYHTLETHLLYPTEFMIVILTFGICLFHNHRHQLTQP